MDDTLGFLLFALKKQRALPFWGPAYTAHLEVEYKAVSLMRPMHNKLIPDKALNCDRLLPQGFTVQHVTLLQPLNASTGRWCTLPQSPSLKISDMTCFCAHKSTSAVLRLLLALLHAISDMAPAACNSRNGTCCSTCYLT